MAAVSLLLLGASDCVLWRLRDACGSQSVDFDTNFADSEWVGGSSPDVLSKKQSFPGSIQKCSEASDFDVIFTKSGRLAKARVFCYFFCVCNKYGAGKMQIFDVQRLILKVFGGSWRRPGQALVFFGVPIRFVGILLRKCKKMIGFWRQVGAQVGAQKLHVWYKKLKK